MKKRSILLIFILLFAMACDPIKTPSDDSPTDVVAFNQKPSYDSKFVMRLAEGEDLVYLLGNIQVVLTRIKDNRCPLDKECDEPGSVQVVFEVDFVGEDPFEEILTLGGDSVEQPAFAVYYGNIHMTLLAVEPQSSADGKVSPEEQTVYLSVSRHAIQ